MNGPFHAGELAAQRLAGQASAGGAIYDAMPAQHREFFAAQAFLLSGPPGFAASPDPHTLRLAVAADPGSAPSGGGAAADSQAALRSG
jgi:predicted pyridoxine 5'-phosphate oxidase superfamily flavin-nucleotide-binding protein